MTATSMAPPPVRPGAVAAVLARSHEWVHGTRKSDNHSFYYIPGTNSGTVYMADSESCTCPSAQNRPGRCKHSAAVATYLERRQAAVQEDAARPTPSVEVARAAIARLIGENDQLRRHLLERGYRAGDDPVWRERDGQISRLQAQLPRPTFRRSA